MKLNLLPATVAKQGQYRVMSFVSLGILVVSVGAALWMIKSSGDALAQAKKRAEEIKPYADKAVQVSKKADEYAAMASGPDRNVKLAEAMDTHNSVWVDLYRDVLSYTPAFFRVTSISAAPIDAGRCVVRIQGVLRTFQDYADVMLAYYRMEGAISVVRSGYQITDPFVPNLILQDQVGFPVRPGEARIPSDPLDRLNALVERASRQPEGAYTGIGGFGQPDAPLRGAGQSYSVVEVALTLATVTDAEGTVTHNRNLTVPLPRDTIAAAGAAPAGPPITAENPAPGGPPPAVPAARPQPRRQPGVGDED